jgi:hypothetical protein
MITTLLSPSISSLTLARYFCILSSLASNSPLACLTTTLESLLTSTFCTPNSLAIANLAIIASYSTSLLVTLNPNLMAYLSPFPYRGLTITLAPPHLLLAEPSTLTVQRSSSSPPCSAVTSANSAMKSATACPFTECLGTYSRSNSPSSIAHLIRRPEVLGFARFA